MSLVSSVQYEAIFRILTSIELFIPVSDSACKDPSLDKSGPLLASLFLAQSYSIEKRKVVADQIEDIQHTVREWIDAPLNGIDVVVCTGGTGFGTRDVTPEVRCYFYASNTF